MNRHYYLHDAKGKRKLSESELPLRIGGTLAGNFVLPGLDENQVVAYIALENGHAYVQPVVEQRAAETVDLFLNDEHIVRSSWLKSGDRIQINEHVLSWTVAGDKVVIDLAQRHDQHTLHPPGGQPPPADTPPSNELPVRTQASSTRTTSATLRKLMIGSLGLLLLVATYLLMLIPLRVDIEPGADTLSLSGFPPPVELWGSHLVMPGRYTVNALRKGYAPLNSEIEIDRNSDTTLQFQLEELPGSLRLSVQPETDFTLFVDDSETPVDEQGRALIARGTRDIRLQTARYLPYQQTLDIEGYGKLQEHAVELKPAWAMISVASHPAGAALYLDGQLKGQTPLDVEIMQGEHQIKFLATGFKPLTLVHDITAGHDITLNTVELQPLDGELSLSSKPAGASVTLNGSYVGTTPVTLALPAKQKHELQLSKAGFQTLTRQILLQAEETQALDIMLKAEFGTLFISTQPTDAKVLIDGKPVEVRGGRLRLSTLPHQLTVSQKGYHDHRQNITPRKDNSQHVEVSLKPIQAAPPAIEKTQALPTQLNTAGGQSLQLIEPQSVLNMGASRREAGRRANESRRQVRLERPFYLAHRETTNREYRKFQSKHDSGSMDGANLNGDMQPVVNISWEDSARYCNWLSRQQGLPQAYQETNGKLLAVQPMNTGYRLPTEAEWAWVARRLDREKEQRYPWEGSYPPAQLVGNYADAQIADTLADVVPAYDDGYRGSAPVGRFPEWPAGFYDLGGNVAEWVHDYYTLYPGQSMQVVTDPQGPATGTHHSIRGAGWRHGNITELRLSFRDYSNKPRADLGFRIARYAE